MNFWYERYMKNLVSLYTLNKLVNANILTQEDVDIIVADRIAKMGY